MSEQNPQTSREPRGSQQARKPAPAAQPEQNSQPDDNEGGVLTQVRDLASNVAGQASDMVKQRVVRQSSKSASDFADLAQALRLTAKQLSANVASPLLNKTADRIEGFSKLLDEPDLREVARDVERFARKQPVLFLGGAIAVGLATGRLLKGAAGTSQAQNGGSEARSRSSSRGARQTRESKTATEKE